MKIMRWWWQPQILQRQKRRKNEHGINHDNKDQREGRKKNQITVFG